MSNERQSGAQRLVSAAAEGRRLHAEVSRSQQTRATGIRAGHKNGHRPTPRWAFGCVV